MKKVIVVCIAKDSTGVTTGCFGGSIKFDVESNQASAEGGCGVDMCCQGPELLHKKLWSNSAT